MFCPKCGTQVIDDATFCQKCGAKLIVDDTKKQATTPTIVRQMQPPTNNNTPDTSKKKKTKKLPIILSAVAAAFVVIIIAVNFDDLQERGEQARKDEEYIASQKQSSDISLSETYTNAPVGISFHYPAGWVILDSESEFQIVNMIDSQNNADSIASFKVFRIFDQDPFGVFTGDETSVREAVNENAKFLEFESTLIGDVPAKSVTYQKAGLKGDDIITNFWYVIGKDVYQITCSYSASRTDIYKPNFDAIMDSYTITAANTSEAGITENPSAGSQTIQWKAAYANKVKELAAEDFDPLFALINLDDNDIPELVADYSGYGVSVFTWVDETLVAIMENWSYGAMGNHGYDYIPGGNVIRNYNSDQAGAIVNESYMKVNDANELVDIYDETLSYWFFEDTNGNGIMDENEPYSDEPYYYYGNTEITEEKYASYQIPGIYELITGDMSAEEILLQLNDENGTDR